MSTTTRRAVPYPGPSYDPAAGAIALGEPTEDGAAPAWQLYGPESMRSGLIVGAAGMGKSRLLDILAHSAMCSRNTAVWYANPQGSPGAAHLVGAADRAATTTGQIRDLFGALAHLAAERTADPTVFTPTTDRPGVLVLIEELGRVLTDRDIVAVMEANAHLWARCGIGFAAAAGAANNRVFADNVHIRRSLLHQAVLLHTNQFGAAAALGDQSAMPRLPRAAGHGHYLRYSTRSGPRDLELAVPFRAAFLGTGTEAARWFGTVPAARPRIALPGRGAAAA